MRRTEQRRIGAWVEITKRGGATALCRDCRGEVRPGETCWRHNGSAATVVYLHPACMSRRQTAAGRAPIV